MTKDKRPDLPEVERTPKGKPLSPSADEAPPPGPPPPPPPPPPPREVDGD